MNKTGVNGTAATLASLLLTGCLNIYIPKTPHYDDLSRRIVFAEQKNYTRGVDAKYVGGIPTILYDPWWISQFPEEFQTFVFYHEIGHIKFKHLSFGSLEQEADCYSMRYLEGKLNYTPEQIGKVHHTATIFFGERRAEEMLECLSAKRF